MVNQIVFPAPGAIGAFAPLSPQPSAVPFNTGTPVEGPQSTLLNLAIAPGETTGSLSVSLAQIRMSMVQAVLVGNGDNNIGCHVHVGTGTSFGIQPRGTQMLPVFQAGTTLNIAATLDAAQAVYVNITFQVFNTVQPPGTWVSNLSVAGDVEIAAVTGDINVNVASTAELGLSIQASAEGGASSYLATALSNVVTQIKPVAVFGTFKGGIVQSAALGWLQLFDVASTGAVVLGTTVPTWSYPIGPVSTPVQLTVPPEGLRFTTGLQGAWTTTQSNNVAPASALQGNLYYA